MKIKQSINLHYFSFPVICLVLLATAVWPASAQPTPVSPAFWVGMESEPQLLDPAIDFNTAISPQIYETLVTYRKSDSGILPGLATDWSLSGDGLTYTFTIRPDVKFHDDSDLTVQSVVDNFNRWWDPAGDPDHQTTFQPFYFIFSGFKGDAECQITGIQFIDDSHMSITILSPDASFLSKLAMPYFGIASPADFNALIDHPVGTGPFKFSEWVAGDHVLLTANADYYGTIPKISELGFKFFPTDGSGSERLQALRDNTIQAVDDLPNALAPDVQADANLRTLWRNSTGIGYLGINRSIEPLDNVLVRQAIAHAVDWHALVEAYYGLSDHTATQFIPPSLWGRDISLSGFSYDPALAKSLLKRAGFSGGFKVELAYRNVQRLYLPDPSGVANAIDDYLSAIGIITTVQEYSSGEFMDKYYAGELELFLLGWLADYLDPDNFLRPIFCTSNNSLGPVDNVLCSMIESARVEKNLHIRDLDYQAINRYVNQAIPLVAINHFQGLFAVRKEVIGAVATPFSLTPYLDPYHYPYISRVPFVKK